MDNKTEFRDAWAQSKQAAVPQVLQAAAAVVQEISRGGLALDQLMRQMAQAIWFKDFYAGVDRLAELSRSVSYNVHNLKLLCDFQIPPQTLFTDHYINQFFLMSATKRTWWVEGPAFCGSTIEPGSRMLEFGCGTGYYTDVFRPVCVRDRRHQYDPRAIETARRLHHARNIRYEVMDFRTALPEGQFDAVVWSPTNLPTRPTTCMHSWAGFGTSCHPKRGYADGPMWKPIKADRTCCGTI